MRTPPFGCLTRSAWDTAQPRAHHDYYCYHCYFQPMKIIRLYQPRSPLFWIMVALNALSALLAWVTHTQPLGVFASVLVTCFALDNAVLGVWLAWRLVNS